MGNITKLSVNAGACRFITTIEALSEDGMTVSLNIDSGCPHVKELAGSIRNADIMDAVATPITQNPVFMKCSEYLVHAACPIPAALVKACEAAGGLALKKNVTMTYE